MNRKAAKTQRELDSSASFVTAPYYTPVGRLDEVAAAKRLELRWQKTASAA
jgi:hypothetical protein